MPGYFMLLIDINDEEGYAPYARTARPTYLRYGGRMLVRGPVTDVVEGQDQQLGPGRRWSSLSSTRLTRRTLGGVPTSTSRSGSCGNHLSRRRLAFSSTAPSCARDQASTPGHGRSVARSGKE